MHRFVWAASLILAAILAAGCASNNREEDNINKNTGPVEPSALAAAKARYAAIPGALVGEVEDVSEPFAAVSGIDAAAVKPDDVLHFIDVNTDNTVAQGFVNPGAGSGRIIVKYIPNQRAPQKGDLVIKLK
jgi:hypothetical protein